MTDLARGSQIDQVSEPVPEKPRVVQTQKKVAPPSSAKPKAEYNWLNKFKSNITKATKTLEKGFDDVLNKIDGIDDPDVFPGR
jgi:uncharacterized protein with gpF-like domain